MKVTIPGFVAPIAGARVEIEGRVVFLRPRDKYPIFEKGARQLKGIEHLMGPLTVDYPAPARAPKAPKAPAAPAETVEAEPIEAEPEPAETVEPAETATVEGEGDV